MAFEEQRKIRPAGRGRQWDFSEIKMLDEKCKHTIMNKKQLIPIVLAFAGFVLACTGTSPKEHADQASSMDSAQLVKRGEYLVSVIGCDDCHSPKKMGPNGPEIDMDLRLSGAPGNRPMAPVDSGALKKGWVLFAPDLTSAVGPWGTSFAANLTSDDTGIGNWTEAQFIKALREGKFKGMDNTRPLLPPMPWFNLAKLSDQDLKSIFAFLKTTKPVENRVPAPKLLSSLK
jgi:cytochrome c553